MTIRSVARLTSARNTVITTQRRNFATFMRSFAARNDSTLSQKFGSSTQHQPFLQFQRRFQSTYTSSASSSDLHSQYNLFARYVRFCNEQQMAAAILTSFVLWSLGDVITQKLESVSAPNTDESKPSPLPPSLRSSFSFLNLKRLAATAFFGVSIAGVGGFYWYRLLDKAVTQWLRITPAKSGYARFTAAKLGLEFLIWHPVSLALFWLYLGVFSEGKSLSAICKQWVTDLPTAIAADMCLWLPIDIINFRFMPVHLQVIVVNIGSLFEAVLLSYLHGASGHGHSSVASNEHDADRHNNKQVSSAGGQGLPITAHPSAKSIASSTAVNKKSSHLCDESGEDKVHWF